MKQYTLEEFQSRAMSTAEYRAKITAFVDLWLAEGEEGRKKLIDLFCLLYAACGAAGEVGELCNQIKKVLRDDGGIPSDVRKEKLGGELGGVFWYTNAALPTELGISPSTAASSLLYELEKRRKAGTICGDGDKRG